MGVEKIINNNNDKQGPCLAPMGSGLNAREAIACLCPGQRGWGGGRTLVKATQLGSGATCRLVRGVLGEVREVRGGVRLLW